MKLAVVHPSQLWYCFKSDQRTRANQPGCMTNFYSSVVSVLRGGFSGLEAKLAHIYSDVMEVLLEAAAEQGQVK